MNDLSEAFRVDEAIKHMTPEKQEAIRAAASAITGEPQESTERAAALLISDFEQAQKHPTIESAFNEIEQEAQKVLLQPEAPDGSQEASVLDAVQQATIVILEQLSELINSGKLDEAKAELRAFTKAFSEFGKMLRQSLEDSKADLERLQQRMAEAQDLEPYISEVMAEYETLPEYQDLTIREFLDPRADEDGNPLPSLYDEIIEKAKDRRAGSLPKPVKPKNLLYVTNALSRYLREGYNGPLINGGPRDLPMPLKGAPDMEIYFNISDVSDPNAPPSNLTPDEELLLNAVYSVWLYAEDHGESPSFTNDTIYDLLPGWGSRASSERSDNMSKFWRTLETHRAEFDATDYLRAMNKIGENDSWHFSEMALYLSTGYGTIAGKDMVVYTMTRQPIGLRYLRATNQIGSIKASLLKIRKATRPLTPGGTWGYGAAIKMNEDRERIVYYLVKRIGIMKNDITRAKDEARAHNRRHKNEDQRTIDDCRELGDTILFDAVLKEADLFPADKKKRKQVRDLCLQVLDFWEGMGHIAGYRVKKSGKVISGVEIIHEYQTKRPKDTV